MSSLYQQLGELIRTGKVLPGDGVVYRYAKPSVLQKTIARVQARVMRDLDSETVAGRNREVGIEDVARFTHAGMVASRFSTVEMTSPRCWELIWEERFEGVAEAVVVRPRDASAAMLLDAVELAIEDVGTPYPKREILLYWLWSWEFLKLRCGQRFEWVFRSRERDVCSGSLVHWWLDAGLCRDLKGQDRKTEGWYPGRLLADDRFEVVAVLW